MLLVHYVILSALLIGPAFTDYPCICNHGEPRDVWGNYEPMEPVIGTFNKSTCRSKYTENFTDNEDFYAIHFQHQIGFIERADINETVCKGTVPASDIGTLVYIYSTVDATTTNTTIIPSIIITTIVIKTPTITSTTTIIIINTTNPTTTAITCYDYSTTNRYTEEKKSNMGRILQVSVPVYTPGTSWPAGTYGLMKPAQGCPDERWLIGWREQDSEDIGTNNHFTSNIHIYMSGTFGDNIRTEFCMKTYPDGGEDWPAGSYCILKKHDCPTGFSVGYIYWDDEDLFNDNDKGGSLPDGTYEKDTKIYYCCRDDGSVDNAIVLPTAEPFILVRYSRECQRVRDMFIKDLYVRWDDDDLLTGSDVGGMHPADEDGGNDHLLHFCFYAHEDDPIVG